MSTASSGTAPGGLLAGATLTSIMLLSSCSSSDGDNPVDDPPVGLPVIVAEGDMLTSDASCANGGVQLGRRFSTPFAADTVAAIEDSYRQVEEIDSADSDKVRFLTDRGSLGRKPDLSSWITVLSEEFDGPTNGDHADLSGALDWRRWSTKNAFSTTLDATTVPGEDSFRNINTTGRYPGQGPKLSNFDDDIARIEVLDRYFDSADWMFDGSPWRVGEDTEPRFPVFQLDDDSGSGGSALRIAAHRSVGPSTGSEGQRPYVSGLISSHADPDPENASTVPPHGFEFRYGYVEARIRLPSEGNGIRTAFWLYSDNAYTNAVAGENSSRHEIDVMEFLPNSEADTNCYTPQPLLFAGTTDNTQRTADRQFMTYDTVFNTYHYQNLARRTPTDWTFNSSDRYRTRRDLAFSIADKPPFGFTLDENAPGAEGWITFAVLWEADTIEWYINDVLIHRVVEIGEQIPGVQHVAPVFDERLYLIVSLAMGFGGFEGDVDDSIFDPVADGGAGPAVEIDYIRVLQDPENPAHVRCGLGHQHCDLTVGMNQP